jgi:AcrR family transcriptional regulator
MTARRPDPRAGRTRDVLRQAFIELFFARDYDEISMADIAARAGVGRSTVYEHYRGKEALMRDTVRYPLRGLAAAVDGDVAAVQGSLDHFWANRSRSGAIRHESSRRAIARVLAALIEERLAAACPDGNAARQRVTGVLVAETQMAAIHAWLRGDLALPAAELARVVSAMAQTACARPADAG